jgi:hypothetical protein
MSDWTYSRILRFIDDRIEEDLHLDYKAAAALRNRDEVVKDVTAFANSDGGTIIYGLAENPDHKHFPGFVDPVDRKEFTKEWIEQILEKAAPRLEGVLIHPVSVGDDYSHVAYVLEIPRSRTVHQAPDGRYYRRHNFKNLPMHDYEIRESMDRDKHPSIHGEMRIVFGDRMNGHFLVRLTNKSGKIAKCYICRVTLPLSINDQGIKIKEDATLNEVDLGGYAWSFAIGQNPNRTPLFPQDKVILRKEFELDFNGYVGRKTRTPLVSSKLLQVSVFADEMPALRATIDPQELLGDWVPFPLALE